ncbi:hypothetical protein E2542_SST20115 [Spatholobus suberectus]|nr:hypothetical protein E2542_SST20115 [Spatholobus suberectus]
MVCVDICYECDTSSTFASDDKIREILHNRTINSRSNAVNVLLIMAMKYFFKSLCQVKHYPFTLPDLSLPTVTLLRLLCVVVTSRSNELLKQYKKRSPSSILPFVPLLIYTSNSHFGFMFLGWASGPTPSFYRSNGWLEDDAYEAED